jgi:hypothetical protein
LVSRIASPYPGANHVAPPAAKDVKEYRTRSPQRRNRRSSGSINDILRGAYLRFTQQFTAAQIEAMHF